jgi:hypothetical protein
MFLPFGNIQASLALRSPDRNIHARQSLKRRLVFALA